MKDGGPVWINGGPSIKRQRQGGGYVVRCREGTFLGERDEMVRLVRILNEGSFQADEWKQYRQGA